MADIVRMLLQHITEGMESLLNFNTLLTVIAGLICLLVLKRVVWSPFKLYVLAQYLPGVKLVKLGRWAVVTGATDGIGKAYCRSLASKGLDIVLISRSMEKLEKVKEEIIRDYGREVKTIEADFARTDIYEQINSALEGLNIAILVNSVGMAQEFTSFLKMSNIADVSKDLINVNSMSMLRMSALVLPAMVERGQGVIVNISSCLAYISNENVSVYSATKSFNLKLAKCMKASYKDSGVIIQTLTPGVTQTKMLAEFLTKNPTEAELTAQKAISITPDKFVSYAINTIGWSDECEGHPFHYIITLLLTAGNYL